MTGRKLVINAAVLATLMLGGIWMGCNSSDNSTNPVTPPPTIAPPTNLRAFSAGPTSVGLLWGLSTSESDTTFHDLSYLVVAKDPSGSVSATLSVAKGTGSVTVASLLEGVIYTFVVRSTSNSGTVVSDSASVRWSPARRYTTDSLSAFPISVYELRSTLGASGLQFNSNGSYAKVRSLSASNPDRFLCDIYVDSINGGAIRLKNIGLLAYPRNTFFSTQPMHGAADDMTDPQVAPPDTISYQLNWIDIPSTTFTQSQIVYARSTTDNKYVRILILKNSSTNLLYSGSGSDRYVTLILSYQNTAGNWFARPDYTPRTPGQ